MNGFILGIFLIYTLIMTRTTRSLQNCSLNKNEQAMSAYKRASTLHCKNEIHALYCRSEEHEHLINTHHQYSSTNILYKSRLKRMCPRGNVDMKNNVMENFHSRITSSKFFVSCMTDQALEFFINTFQHRHFRTGNQFEFDVRGYNVDYMRYEFIDTLQLCIDICLMRHRFVAFNARQKQCVCLADLSSQYWSSVFFKSKEKCLKMLDQNENNLYEVYETGYTGKFFNFLLFIQ